MIRINQGLGKGMAVAMIVAGLACSRHRPERTEQEMMVETQIAARGITNLAVLSAMRRVPRHEFVPAEFRAYAYEDGPLPIGREQTISQPFIVAQMTELARIRRGDKVLEVGTGSGYQAAVLAEITPHVFTIEIIESLAVSARERLQRLGYSTVQVRFGDGYLGWPDQAPFDAILVTAAAEQVPAPLLEQLKPGGRLVMPKGEWDGGQMLVVVVKDPAGKVTVREIEPVRFVPLTRQPRP